MQKFMCYCTVFALFYFEFEGIKFPNTCTSPRGLIIIWRGDLTEGLLRYEFGGLIFGGAYFWNFTVSLLQANYQASALANVRPQQPG